MKILFNYLFQKGSVVLNSQELHDQYYYMYDKQVKITLKNGTVIVGLFNDEFFEDNSILVNCKVIKIKEIDKMELVKE